MHYIVKAFELLRTSTACVILFMITVWLAHAFVQQIDRADNLRRIDLAGDRLLIALLDAETGQRGFVITGNEAYLVPFYAGISAIPSKMNDLRNFTASTEEENNVNQISRLTNLKSAELSKVVIMRRQSFAEASAEVDRHLGKSYMDQIRQHLDDLSAWSGRKFSHAGQLASLYARLTFAAAMLTIGFGFANAYPRR